MFGLVALHVACALFNFDVAMVYVCLAWLTFRKSVVYVWPGRLTCSLFFRCGYGIVYVWRGWLHLIRILFNLGLPALHLMSVFFNFGQGIVYCWFRWTAFGQGLVDLLVSLS